MPLGVMPNIVFDAAPPIALEPGELVLLLTDGIMEARAADDRIFGIERAIDSVRANRAKIAREIVDTLYYTVCDFCRGRSRLDDMTAVVVKVGPS